MDGTIWNGHELWGANHYLGYLGGIQNDILTGIGGPHHFRGMQGNDSITASGGGNHFHWYPGDGQDTINVDATGGFQQFIHLNPLQVTPAEVTTAFLPPLDLRLTITMPGYPAASGSLLLKNYYQRTPGSPYLTDWAINAGNGQGQAVDLSDAPE